MSELVRAVIAGTATGVGRPAEFAEAGSGVVFDAGTGPGLGEFKMSAEVKLD